MSEQKIIFISPNSKNAKYWPFFNEMQLMGADVEVIAGDLALNYSHRIWLYLFHWPLLIVKSVILARSCIKELADNSVLVFQSHMMLFIYKKIAAFSFRARKARPKLVLHGLIYTPRQSNFVQKLRALYFKHTLHKIHLIICYSQYESKSIDSLIDSNFTRIIPVRYGIGEGPVISKWYDSFRNDEIIEPKNDFVNIITAGRSSRDYRTLVDAVENARASIVCNIVCDNYQAAPESLKSDRVIIHRNTYGHHYIEKILAADIAVIPLTTSDISAGQMVMLQALSAAKPVIITDIKTIREYVEDNPFIKLVPPFDTEAMAKAIEEIAERLPLKKEERLGLRKIYDDNFSDRAHGRQVLNAILSLDS